MNGAVLEVENLHVHFPAAARGEKVKAVDGMSFSVHAGETFGIIGESGSGKSTLARSMVCLLRPTVGRVLHAGRDPYALPSRELRRHRRRYQIVFQDPDAALNPRMRIGASLREPLDVAGEGRPSERVERIRTLLDRVGLRPDVLRSFPHELSGGMKQRAIIARALALRPELIVCDEVVAALDASIRADVLNLFADLQHDFHLTYVFITHDLGIVAHISDRIAVMYLGRLMELGPTERLMAAPLHPYTQALLSAEPVPLPSSLREPRRIRLVGEIPSPIDPPSGCRFRTRCPLAVERCAAEVPQWRDFGGGHFAACHVAGQNSVGTAGTTAAQRASLAAQE
jgi:peptide/nickel transport system ATP-binding protein/oligopeptide transport system ATP-binding protein